MQNRTKTKRAPWNPQTFDRFRRAHGLSRTRIARRARIAVSIINKWQAPRSGGAPSIRDRERVARALSDLSGSNITPDQLGREIRSVRFTFYAAGEK